MKRMTCNVCDQPLSRKRAAAIEQLELPQRCLACAEQHGAGAPRSTDALIGTDYEEGVALAREVFDHGR